MKKSIKNIIEKTIPQEHMWKFELFKHWDTIIGPLKQRVSIEKIDNNTLYLFVSHPAWAQEIHLLTPLICTKINNLFSEKKIIHIRFKNRQAPELSTPKKQPPIQNYIDITRQSSQLSFQELSTLAPLESQELQSIIAAYLIRCKIIQRSKNELCAKQNDDDIDYSYDNSSGTSNNR